MAQFEPYRDARTERLWPIEQYIVQEASKNARQQRPPPGSQGGLLPEANAHTRWHRERAPVDATAHLIALAVMLGVSVVPCLLSALIFRGGVRNLLVGVDLVRADGRPAGRLRCAWRALMAWNFLAAPLFLARWLEEGYWARWTPQGGPVWLLWASAVCWVLALVLPGVCLVAILLTPARSLHDRLSGTWLVPR